MRSDDRSMLACGDGALRIRYCQSVSQTPGFLDDNDVATLDQYHAGIMATETGAEGPEGR